MTITNFDTLKFAHLERDILVLKWMVGLVIVVTVVPFIKSILG